MAKVLVLYYSSYGHLETMAKAVAEGAREAGASVDIKRVPETVPLDIAKSAHFKLDQEAPVASVEDLANYDAIIVGAPDHPLAQGRNPPGAARGHTQLVLTDRSKLTDGRDFAVGSVHTWRLADLGAKHLLMKEGFGWGNMPEPMVREDIAAGRLKRLDMPDLSDAVYTLHAIYRSDTPPGPATAFLIERFRSQAN